MAEALLARKLANCGIEANVSSTGLIEAGRPATPEGATVMGKRGFDLGPHRSRVLDFEQVKRADLVLGMARQHVREAYLAAPGRLERIFTLREIVRRGEAVGPCDGDLGRWLARVAGGRRPTELVGESPEDDVADPYGQPVEQYERTADVLDDLTGRLARLLCGGREPIAAAEGQHGASER